MRAVSGESEWRHVPKALRGALYAYLIIAGALGVAVLDGYSPLPTTVLLDAWIVAFTLTAVVRGKGHRVGALLLIGVYAVTRLAPAVLNDSPFEDVLQAYRWLLYLVAFVLAANMRWGPEPLLRRVVLILVGMALTKAALSFAVGGPGKRPGLFIENNFEIALFCGLVLVIYRQLSPTQRLGAVLMLAVLMLLGGSRSGAVAFAVLVVYVLAQSRATTATKVFAGAYALPAIAAVPVFVFVDRARTSTQLDRLNFLDVFLAETRNWDLLTWLFGTEPITPLSPIGCGKLAYYEALFSTTGDGSCYSVILHAFVLRAVFDAGLMGLLIAFLVPWIAMRWGGVPTVTALGLLGIAASNSLSVSGLNNPYVALPILMAILIARREVSQGLDPDQETTPVRVGDGRRSKGRRVPGSPVASGPRSRRSW